MAGFQKIEKIINWEEKKKTAQKLHTKNHFLADEISRYFNEPKKFAMYLGIISRVGFNRAYRIFAEIKQSKAKTPAKLFMWKVGQLKIKKKKRKSPPKADQPRAGKAKIKSKNSKIKKTKKPCFRHGA